MLYGTRFDDVIALAGRHFDLGRILDVETQKQTVTGTPSCENLMQAFAHNRVKLGVTQIPYRALIPKGSYDMIAAGRCIAADGQALGPARIMSTCMAVGEAAGVATMLKLRNDVPYRDVDVEELRDILRGYGAEIDI